jgi:hypothetical protein
VVLGVDSFWLMRYEPGYASLHWHRDAWTKFLIAEKTIYQFMLLFLHILSQNYHLSVTAEAAALNMLQRLHQGSQCVPG